MDYPIYNSPEAHALPTGMYLGLFHGRDDVTADMPDWGFDGPVIGPLEFVHTTYGDTVKVCLRGNQAETLFIQLVGDCLPFGDKFYGDWTVFYHQQRREKNQPVDHDRRKT